MAKIHFSGQYTRPLFFRGVRLANAPRRGGQITFWLALGAVLGLLWVAWQAWRNGASASSLGMYAVVLFLLLLFIGQAALLPWLAARKLWQNPNVRRPLQGWANEQGITYRLPQGEKHIAWERIIRLRQRPDLLALVTREGLMLLFTPDFFHKPAHWERFRHLVRTHVIPLQ